MRASSLFIIFCSLGILGLVHAEIIARQDVEPSKASESASPRPTPTEGLSSKPSDTVIEISPSSDTRPTYKPDATEDDVHNPFPSDISFLNRTASDPNVLPLAPRITPGLSVAGVVLLIAGGIYTLIGIKNKWVQIFLSVGLLSALSVTILIIYLMHPPISNAVQGAFFVAVLMTGLIFGGIALVFQEVTEGLGTMLGGFCLSMWILSLKPGGVLVETGHKAGFIASFTLGVYTLSFSHHTRPYGLMGSTSFSGATAVVLGIDCFSRAGLKEFWVYIWGLNHDVFPFNTVTYPLTRGVRVELAAIVLFFIMGLVSQGKLWKVVKDRREKNAALREEEQKKRDKVEEEIARDLEAGTNRERAQWESVYGEHHPRPNDPGVVLEHSDMQESCSGAPSDKVTAVQSQVYEMAALRRQAGEEIDYTPPRTRDSNKPFVAAAAAMPIQCDVPVSEGSNTEGAHGSHQDVIDRPEVSQKDPHSTLFHQQPFETETPVPVEVAPCLRGTNPFEDILDDGSSSVAASLAESEYMTGVRLSAASMPEAIHGQDGKINNEDDHDPLSFNDVRSVSSSVEVEPNEELIDDSETSPQAKSDVRSDPGSTASSGQESSGPTPVTDADLSEPPNASNRDENEKDDTSAPVSTILPTHLDLERIPRLADSNNEEADQEVRSEHPLASDVDSDKPELLLKPVQHGRGQAASPSESVYSDHAPAISESLDESKIEISDKQLPDIEDDANDAQESLSVSIPVLPKKVLKKQSSVSVRSLLTSDSVSKIPSHMSRVVLTYRTNEWAKHISDAEPPGTRTIDESLADTERDEPAVPVLISELQQTATSTMSPTESEFDRAAISTSQQEGHRPLSISSKRSYSGMQTFNNAPLPVTFKPSPSATGSQTPLIHPLQRPMSMSNLPQSVLGQFDMTRIRPTSSLVSLQRPPSIIPEIDETEEKNPPVKELRMFAAPLMAQREVTIRNRSLLLPSNRSVTDTGRLNRSQSRRSLDLPPQTSSRSTSPYLTRGHTPVESADDLPLSLRRELIHQDMYTQTQTWQQRSPLAINFAASDIMPLVNTRRSSLQYQQHQSSAPNPLEVREVKLARWRESVNKEIAMEHQPDAVVETRRADLIKEKERSQLGKQQEAIMASYRESVRDQAIRKGDLQNVHTEVLRRMQAKANKHV
ncbi:hypothetical protein AJ79_00614 [Helicocarpus griseus UAMH5409]|uniref:TM7S3/TM198-like domain-containing protein n=1 Tax=Helicocarpus griseus UAMH5409 TaxID=1447875 RepID=A0A2B7YAI7_9EURO|nr:hypothetical protein AJ79_00614 [Helicocarpus griseus UAMH5409]